MREKRTFAERTQVFASDKTLRKYFLVYEGSETEAIYFDAVSSLREKIEINPLLENCVGSNIGKLITDMRAQ